MVKTVCLSVMVFFVFLLNGCSVPHPPSIPLQALSGSRYYSANTKKLISQAMVLSRRNLNYRFGSSNPYRGGMDCSGTLQYLINHVAHIHAPRDASMMYSWVKLSGRLHIVHAYFFHSSQFNDLKPGDLLFWTGTYYTRHKPPITHVMLYIGKDARDRPLMFGATEGTYHGRIVRGIGVFDFVLPYRSERAKFVGYGCIPSYTCE